MSQKVITVIGKNFGDEGKGLAVDYFCSKEPSSLVIKHNGGGQAGHTVDLPDGRFVFHQLASGSFRGAHTLWARTYYPDLYKLAEEVEAFANVSKGRTPVIFAQATTYVTTIDDVLINMALESARGDDRHGSCGMGINEADLRTKAGFGISFADLMGISLEELVEKLAQIRATYGKLRLEELGINLKDIGEYGELLSDETVLVNAAIEMLSNLSYVEVIDDPAKLCKEYKQVVFETGQGLLLDGECQKFFPHVTASRTGLTNPVMLSKEYGISMDEVVYVTRSYVTRHGAGMLPYECEPSKLGIAGIDQTNLTNPWQGSLRFAPHGSLDEFMEYVDDDINAAVACGMASDIKRGIMITHLNESRGQLLTVDGPKELEEFEEKFDVSYISRTPYSCDVE